MTKGLPTSCLLFLLLALVSVEVMVIKVKADMCFMHDSLGSCTGEEACWKACREQHDRSTGYCEDIPWVAVRAKQLAGKHAHNNIMAKGIVNIYDAKQGLPKVCTCSYPHPCP